MGLVSWFSLIVFWLKIKFQFHCEIFFCKKMTILMCLIPSLYSWFICYSRICSIRLIFLLRNFILLLEMWRRGCDTTVVIVFGESVYERCENKPCHRLCLILALDYSHWYNTLRRFLIFCLFYTLQINSLQVLICLLFVYVYS